MSAYFFFDFTGLLIQIVINYMTAHGVSPINGSNVVGVYLTFLTRGV